MKKLSLVLTTLLVTVALVGCGNKNDTTKKEVNGSIVKIAEPFELVKSYGNKNEGKTFTDTGVTGVYEVYDKNTKQMFYYTITNNSRGDNVSITQMLNNDGTVKIYEEK